MSQAASPANGDPAANLPTDNPPAASSPSPVDVDSPAPTDPTSAAARCAQLESSRPALNNTVYDTVSGGVLNEVLIGNSINDIIAAIGDIEAYFNSINGAHLGASNVLLSAQSFGDISVGFGTVYIVGTNEGQASLKSVVGGAPATVVMCGVHASSVALGVGNLVLVNSTVDSLIGAAITVVESNSSVGDSTVGLLTVKQ